MTEPEKIRYAKMFLDQLAAGINPLDGSCIPEDDVARQVRISHCFAYVSSLLDQLLLRLEAPPQPAPSDPPVPHVPAGSPVSPSFEQRSRFSFSSEPLQLRDLTQRLNDILDPGGTNPLSHRTLSTWLVSIGLLTIPANSSHRQVKVPTPMGESLGIQSVPKQGAQGPYHQVLYHREAQQFILDNLDDLLAFQAHFLLRQDLPWKQEEEAMLTTLFRQGLSLTEISIRLQRKSSSIRTKLRKLGQLPPRGVQKQADAP